MRPDKRSGERLDQDMRKDDERQRSEEAASHLAGPARHSVSRSVASYVAPSLIPFTPSEAR